MDDDLRERIEAALRNFIYEQGKVDALSALIMSEKAEAWDEGLRVEDLTGGTDDDGMEIHGMVNPYREVKP